MKRDLVFLFVRLKHANSFLLLQITNEASQEHYDYFELSRIVYLKKIVRWDLRKQKRRQRRK